MPPNSTLSAIQTKVRRLTRSPSDAQLSDADINEYVNTFFLYDFPEHLRLIALKTTLTFYTEPNQDVYTPNVALPNPLSNFNNRYVSFTDPVYIAGYQCFYSQSREQFFGIYPKVSSITNNGMFGNALGTTHFTGTLSAKPILKNNVLFSSVDINNNGLALTDDGAGNLFGNGTGLINYLTGAFVLDFATAPGNGKAINSQTTPYIAALPKSILFFDETFTVRPVPDQPYRIDIEAYIRPTELLAGFSPELEQWWQYIAYGAAKKILEDRMDTDTVQQIMPEFKQQERLVLRTTIAQQTSQRTATIYTESTSGSGYGPYGPGGFWGGGIF